MPEPTLTIWLLGLPLLLAIADLVRTVVAIRKAPDNSPRGIWSQTLQVNGFKGKAPPPLPPATATGQRSFAPAPGLR